MESSDMAKLLITGVGGYIGSNAANYFLQTGFEVTGMIHRKKSARCLLPETDLLQADLNHPESLEKLFCRQYDFVIHIAARASDVGRDELFRTANFEAVKHLSALCMKHQVRRFVYLSTSDVYGLHDFHGETEDELSFDYSEGNPYPKYKIKSEEYLRANLPPERFSCVRPCVVWGNGDTTITPRAIAYLKSSPWVFHFGHWHGQNRWPLAHVENVCRTLHAAMLLPEAGGKGVTVLDSKRTSMMDFYRELAALYLPDKVIREVFLPKWTVYPAAWISSSLSTLFGCNTPVFDPTLYALETITHNLDFSNARMLDWLAKSNLQEFKS